MGLTNQSTGSSILGNSIIIDRSSCCGSIIALSGNPNVGKSTVFNSLTGLNQHTGNWPGKTVTTCYGKSSPHLHLLPVLTGIWTGNCPS
jgi:ferrous iron transport protein B